MIKIQKIDYNDVYNQVTDEYFPKLIDTASVHVETFPSDFNFLLENTWEATLPRFPTQTRYCYHMCLTTEWETTFTFKLKNWWLAGYPLMFNYCEGLKFGKIINIRSEELIRSRDEIKVTKNRKNFRPFSDMGVKKVPLLEVVELTSLEYCELIEWVNR